MKTQANFNHGEILTGRTLIAVILSNCCTDIIINSDCLAIQQVSDKCNEETTTQHNS